MYDNKITLSDYYNAKDRIRELENERDNLINSLKKAKELENERDNLDSLGELPSKQVELEKRLGRLWNWKSD